MQEQTTAQDFKSMIPVIEHWGNYLLRHQRTARNLNPFFLDDIRFPVYELVYRYFARDPAFLKSKSNYSFSKGLLIIGDVGTGKTLLMEIFSKIAYTNFNSPLMSIISSDELVREFIMLGMPVIDKYSKNFYFSNDEPKQLCIDELGMEDQEAKNYANKMNVIKTILFARNKLHRSDGMITHGTSNLDELSLQKLYGKRVGDRLPEEFNVIVLNGKSLRK